MTYAFEYKQKLMKQEMSVICEAMDLNVRRTVIYILINPAAAALLCTLPQYKEGFGCFFVKILSFKNGSAIISCFRSLLVLVTTSSAPQNLPAGVWC